MRESNSGRFGSQAGGRIGGPAGGGGRGKNRARGKTGGRSAGTAPGSGAGARPGPGPQAEPGVENAARNREFGAFVSGAAGRLLHVATLLTTEPAHRNPLAQELLTAALAHTYARWDRLRGEDPYNETRADLATRFARTAWRHHRGRGGVLSALTPQERLVVVLRLHEGVAEEQTAALLGLPEERIRAVCSRSVSHLREAS